MLAYEVLDVQNMMLLVCRIFVSLSTVTTEQARVEQSYLPAQTTGRPIPQMPYFRPTDNDR